jgi:predicted RecA/RadA family phage recombinase
MKTYLQNGKTIPLIAPYAVTPGQGLLVGSIFGFAVDAAALGVEVETMVTECAVHPKAAGAVTQGQLLYWDNAARLVTTASAGNKLIGVAMKAQGAGDATVNVRLNGAFIS